VYTSRNPFSLAVEAQANLWSQSVALTVATWDGQRGGSIVKLAPFFVPPFRTLLMNAHGDFFRGTPRTILRHVQRKLWDYAGLMFHAAQDAISAEQGRLRRLTRGVRHRAADRFERVEDVVSALLLLAGATVLRWFGYPHRRWFANVHGAESTVIMVPPSTGSSVELFRHRGPHWHAEPFRKALVASNARWIVWSQDEEPGCVDDLLPLFDDPRTFAVSRQRDYRAWKPSLMAMAPFRALEQGEASQVLAPLSNVIVIDRQKLAALGIPDCSLAGTAWLLLFWNAAAAGWRSYSAGGKVPVSEQADFPSYEAEFCWRVLTDRAARRLGPHEPDLGGGAISFRAAARRGSRFRTGHLRVLIVSPFLPYPLSHGGAVRIYNLCRALAGRVDFILLAGRERQDRVDYAKLEEVFREIRVVDFDESPSGESGLPKQVRHSQSRALGAAVRDLCRSYHPDAIQIEYTHMAQYRDPGLGIPFILVEHDLTWSLYRQIAEREATPASRAEYEAWRRFERRQLREFEALWTVSDEDRGIAISEGGRPGTTVTVANGVDLTRFVPSGGFAREPEILFVGSFRHLPNVLGFEKLRREVMPGVWDRLPELRLRVVAGPEHEYYWRQFAGPGTAQAVDGRITVHDFVEDLRPLYARAWAVVVPLEVSAGTNIKVLEAMACERAVVTTPVGCAGLGLRDGRDAVIRDDWNAFADSVCELISNADLRSAIARQARRTAEERFGWDAIAERAYEAYLAISAGAESAAPESILEPQTVP
jgi:glycosyltransferase involved in cell wall biosynthesis